MRRSTLILFLCIEAAGLFIFENLHAIFRQLEKGERQAICRGAELTAELLVCRHGNDVPAMRRDDPRFDSIQRLPRGDLSRSTFQIGNLTYLRLDRLLPDGGRARFSVPIRSVALASQTNARKIMAGVIIVLAVFLLVTGGRLVFLYRRPPTAADPDTQAIHPFHDYLAELRSTQHELQETVSEKARAAGRGEELNRSIIQNLHLGVLLFDSGGRIELVNPAALDMFDRAYAHIKNNTAHAILGDHPPLLEFVLRTRDRRSVEIECGERIFLADLIPVGDIGRLLLVRDVSEEKKRERIQAIHANLIMLGEMAAALAHETRNSLGVILGYAKSGREPERTERIIQEIHFLNEMMGNFLHFSKPVGAVKRQLTDLKPLLQNLASAHDIALRLADGPWELESDPTLLQAVFSNLIRNAREAGASEVQVGCSRLGKATVLEFLDDGPGIADPLHDKIWLPFFTTRDKGSGMGLPIVKKMVSALDGEISLLPSERGARFRIVFY